jgi:hypothetical protein
MRTVRSASTTASGTRPAAQLVPIEIGPHVRAALAAALANELRLEIGQPDLAGPRIGAEFLPVRAMMVGAIDDQAANAGSAHGAEGDFLGGRVQSLRPLDFLARQISFSFASNSHSTAS